MKKHLILLLVLVLSSCSSDDTKREENNLLFNKWDLKSVLKNGTVITLTPCQELYSGYEFKNNNTCIQGLGKVNTSSVCTNNQYNQNFTLVDNVLTVKETNGYEAKYYLIDLTTTNIRLKLFYSKEIRNGVVNETNIPESEQVISIYEKM